MNVADAIAKWCADIDTPFVAGIPGNGILEIIDSLSQNTDIPFILTRHEQSASMMAYSFAFQTKRPAVAVGSKAPGAANLAIGVMGAFVESLPMIVITAQVSSKHEGYEAFEEIDLKGFFSTITKWSVQVHDPDRTIEVLNEAYRRSMSGRPGPVHIAIPYNFMNHELTCYKAPEKVTTFNVSEDQLREIGKVLYGAKRPLIIAGGGLPPENSDEVLEIARLLDAPVVSSWMRKAVPDRDEFCIGMAGIGGSPAAQRAISEADVVLVLGCRFSEQMTEHYKMKFASDAKLIHIDVDASVIGRVFDAHLGIQENISNVVPPLLRVLEAEVSERDGDQITWRESLQAKQREYLKQLANYEKNDVTPQGRYVVEELRDLLPSNSILVLDSGNYLHWAEQYFPVEQPGLFHYPTSGTMGFGIPGAMGAKFAFPGQFVCALVGDGGFAMTMAELETSKREQVPILVVIINNSTLGHIRIRQEVNFGGRCVGVNFSNQNFMHIAKAFDGVQGFEVLETSKVRETLKEAIKAVIGGQTAVVDVHVSEEMADAPIVNWWPISNRQ